MEGRWTKTRKTERKQQQSNSTYKMDCGPKYSKVSESLRYVTSGSVQCSMFCGGRQCKYEGQTKWSDSEMVIKGLYSSWATDKILAMARPSTRTINKFNVIQQFQRWGITAIVNLQHPGEHANCGFGLEKSGFTYNPEDFMDNRIFFFNFIWRDYGVRSLESILDIVKVMDFALQDGKVAVHCHAGLGRTGVLIACYLIYSSRITPDEAIHIVRKKRPKSVQTRGQISCVQDFAKFLKPLWVIFPTCFDVKPFTLQKYLVRQKYLLHGYEARELKFIPKIIFVPCKRLLELCGLDANKLRLTNNRIIGNPDDEIDSTDGEDELETSENNSNENTCDISASAEDLKGEFDSETVCSNNECDSFNQELSNSQPSGYLENDACLATSVRGTSDSALCVRHKYNKENDTEKNNTVKANSEVLVEHRNGGNSSRDSSTSVPEYMYNEHTTAHDIATAFSTNIKADDDVFDKLEKLQICGSIRSDALWLQCVWKNQPKWRRPQMKILNDSNEGWKMVTEETNPYILITLMVSWIDCLTEPVLSSRDVKALVENQENPLDALLNLHKSQRGIIECLLVTIFKLNPVDRELRKSALLKILNILTHNARDVNAQDNNGTKITSVQDNISSLLDEFLKFVMLLYEKWSSDLR